MGQHGAGDGDVVRCRLVVVRHAKSAWPLGVPDRERPLGDRGRRDAPLMARRIHELVGPIDLAVISPTERTRQTWALLDENLAVGAVQVDARIYQEWGAQMLDLIRELPDAVPTVLILGHEPGVSELVLTLADPADWGLRARVSQKFPTCAVAVLSTPVPWARLTPGCAHLEAFTTPRD